MSTPDASVIVPYCKGAKTSAALIEPLMVQYFVADRYEVIVVDNSSSDSTIARTSPFLVRLLREREIQLTGGAQPWCARRALCPV